MIEVIRFQDRKLINPDEDQVVVTVSKGNEWEKGLSPFFLGPCELWGGHTSLNMENAWQYSKVYICHVDENGDPNKEWFEWAKKGWSDSWAHRYPMGKGQIPRYSYWNREKLGYVEARKRIYIPLYYRAVRKTQAFGILKQKYDKLEDEGRHLYLVDYDAYRHKELGMTYRDVIHCEKRKMGHAFVLAMMLECPDKLKRAISK